MTKREEKREKVRILSFGKIRDKRGNLSVLETDKGVPFDIARTYWIYDVPGGEHRGGHAYYNSREVIIALSGSFDVVVHNGKEESRYHLDRCSKGLYIPAGTWRQMKNFATNSIALVVASTQYTPRDYIRDFDKFISLKEEGNL